MSGSRFEQFSWALLIASLSSAVAAAIGASRVTDVSLGLAWLALWGSTALMVAPVAGALRIARPLSRMAWCLPLGLVVAAAPLLVFARVLKTATHHRPLGGATFAIVAAACILGATALSARMLVWSETGSWPRRRAPALLALVFGLASAKLGSGALLGPLRASAIDGLACLAAIGLGGFVPLPAPFARWAARTGIPVLLVAVVLGIFVGLRAEEVRAALAEHAPVLLGLGGWLRAPAR